MRISRTLYVTNRADWRAWLERNHGTEPEIWLVYFKKHSGKPRIPYDAAVEEALCFGWIDSTVKRIDAEKYAQRFTPRRRGSRWSELNLNRARRMIEEGRMTGPGMARVPADLTPADTKQPPRKPGLQRIAMPRFFREALDADEKARESFSRLAPSYRRMYIGWLAMAKKDKTRRKRLKEAMSLLRKNRKLGLK
ncbi:MAG: YdeI/OmpD-associated family protein [Planctomycetota bacterium]|nr:YdeI/OmpD-associated family protein [Planctomycetota bacterium]